MMLVRELHPDMQVLIDAGEPSEKGESVAEQRNKWTRYTQKLAQPSPDCLNVYDLEIPTKHREVAVRVYSNKSNDHTPGCILYMHGGGFMLGDLDSSDSIAWGFAVETNATVVSVDYRLTPEHPWPAAFDDCYGVLCWLEDHGDKIGIDTNRIALSGDSAGGRLTAALALKARDEGLRCIVAQAIIYASAGAISNAQSREDFADGYGLTTDLYRKYYELLFPDDRFADDPYAWPIRADNLTELPPALVHPAEYDPIRDDGRAYACRLIEAGNSVVFREAKRMIHGFMRARFTGAAAKAEFDFICRFLEFHLQTKSESSVSP